MRGSIQGQAQPSPATVVAPLINGSGKSIASGDAGSARTDQGANLDGTASTSGVPPWSLISAALLAVGLAVFGIRRVARGAGDR